MKYILGIGLSLGVLSQLLFYFGVLGYLSKGFVFFLSGFFVIIISCLLLGLVKKIYRIRLSFYETSLVGVLFIVSAVNLAGAFSPETSFDALWYHLTLPKLYIEENRIFFIPGGLLYYSLLPKTTEMLFIPALMFGSEIHAKVLHYFFGLLVLISIYFVSRLFLNKFFSLIAVCVFATNLVFLWESTVAYNDLTWAFFELMAFYGLVLFIKTDKLRWLFSIYVWLGFAITTKLVAVESLLLYFVLFLSCGFIGLMRRSRTVLALCLIPLSLLVPSPWFLWSYTQIRNPVYPFFTGRLSSFEGQFFTFSISDLTQKLHHLVFFPSDPISPLYLMLLPLIFLVKDFVIKEQRIVFIYTVTAVLLWFLLPLTGGTRFILPYMGVISVGVGIIVYSLSRTKKYTVVYKAAMVSIFIVLITVIFYRGVATLRFVPYLLGFESKQGFLTRNLSFSYGDFFDTDMFFKQNITDDDMVLLIGFHNLYYVDFTFVHESWYNGETISHIAVQNATLPDKYSSWNLVYTNDISNVSVYKRPEKK